MCWNVLYIIRIISLAATAILLILQDYSVEQLEVGYETGADRLLLWLPMVVTHVIDEDSPLANWRDAETVLSDSDATIVVVVSVGITLHAQGNTLVCHASTRAHNG